MCGRVRQQRRYRGMYKYVLLRKIYKPHITYCRSKENSEDNEKAVCIIIYEVPVDVEAKVYTKLGGFSEKTAQIRYR